MANIKHVIVSIDGQQLGLQEAADFLEMPYSQLSSILTKNKAFGYKGFKIERISELHSKRGTTIQCKETGEQWRSIKDAMASTGMKSIYWFSKAIRENKPYKYEGKTYIALDYKPITHNVKSRAKRAHINNKVELKRNILMQKTEVEPRLPLTVPQDAKINSVKAASVKEEAINAVRKYAIDRIMHAQYNAAKEIVQALELISK